MDTLTQALLGAAVGHASVPGRGRRALAFGAVAGILPDLDILASPFQTEVAAFVTHRSATHSFVLIPLAALAFAYLLPRWRGGFGLARGEWLRLLLLCFGTHVLLDLCTSYGTQIFWPISRHPFAWSTVFIVDPLYSLGLAGGIAVALKARSRSLQLKAVAGALALTTGYLVLGAAFKQQAAGVFQSELEARGIQAERFRTQNTPFNILLWHAIIVGDGFVANGYCMFPCEPDGVEFRIMPFNRHRAAVESWIPEFGELAALAKFSKGFYRIREEDRLLVLVDLRFGAGNIRPFAFVVGRVGDQGPESIGKEALRIQLAKPGDFQKEFAAFFGRWQ